MNVVVNTFQGGIVLGGLAELKRTRRKVIVVHDRVPLRIDRSKESVHCLRERVGKVPSPLDRSLKLLGDLEVVLVLTFGIGFLIRCGNLVLPRCRVQIAGEVGPSRGDSTCRPLRSSA